MASYFYEKDACRNRRAKAPKALIALAPNATVIEGLLCLPTAPALPTRDKGIFGTSPIYGQLSDMPLLAYSSTCDAE